MPVSSMPGTHTIRMHSVQAPGLETPGNYLANGCFTAIDSPVSISHTVIWAYTFFVLRNVAVSIIVSLRSR
jgi:hypothetical protein